MSKYELSIASDYVPDWTVVDALRELFQNALDQNDDMTWSYKDEVFSISNKTAVLPAKTLLLGVTTKRNDRSSIGQFGEGYKLAALVLTRLGRQMIIYNYSIGEIWRPRFVKSKRYDTNVLTFFAEKIEEGDGITIEVHGITQEEWDEEIVPSNLHLQSPAEIIESNEYGEALKDSKYSGKVFVNGLYICSYSRYHYGYNFKPGVMTLDRDRRLISDFDLRWQASKFWRDNIKALVLLEIGAADVEFLHAIGGNYKLSKAAYLKFREMHGPRAVPVTDQREISIVPRGYTPIIVSEPYEALIKLSGEYVEPEFENNTIVDKFERWITPIKKRLTLSELSEFNDLLDQLK